MEVCRSVCDRCTRSMSPNVWEAWHATEKMLQRQLGASQGTSACPHCCRKCHGEVCVCITFASFVGTSSELSWREWSSINIYWLMLYIGPWAVGMIACCHKASKPFPAVLVLAIELGARGSDRNPWQDIAVFAYTFSRNKGRWAIFALRKGGHHCMGNCGYSLQWLLNESIPCTFLPCQLNALCICMHFYAKIMRPSMTYLPILPNILYIVVTGACICHVSMPFTFLNPNPSCSE